MAARDPLKEELAELRAVRQQPHAAESQGTLRRILGGKRSHSIAVAAEIAGEADLRELAPLLSSAFQRLVVAGENDPNARAKTAIAVALQKMEHDDADLFLRGITLRQWEAVYGGSVDVAAELRAACALGLAATYDARALPAICDLLVDPEWPARAGAARALGATGRAEADLVLRYKALVGDPEPQVCTEVFGGIIDLAPRDAPAAGIEFVARFLDEPRSFAAGHRHAIVAADLGTAACTACGSPSLGRHGAAVAEAAALALGQSRRIEALAPLRRHAESQLGEETRVTLLAIAMLRAPEALDYLVSIIVGDEVGRATHAIAALGMHRYDEALARRVRAAVDAQKSRALKKAFAEAFEPPGDRA